MNIEQVKENVRKMAAQNAPMQDIDGYIQAAGFTVDDIKNYQPLPQLAPDNSRKYSALDKIIYTARAGAEGLTFGLGDVAAGVTNAPMTYLARLFNGREFAPIRDKKTGAEIKTDRGTLNPLKLFKEGRRDFVNEQKEFASKHSGLNMLGEIGGGLLTGGLGAAKVAGVKGLKTVGSLGKKISKLKPLPKALTLGAGSGGIYGFNSGLTSNADKFTPGQAIKEALYGAAGGAAMGGGLIGAGKLAYNTRKAINAYNNRAYSKLLDVAGDKVHESLEKNRLTPLINIADEPLMRMAEGVKLKNTNAAQRFRTYGDYFRGDQVGRINKIIDKHFGKTPTEIRKAQMDLATQKKAAPLYSEAIYGKDRKGVFIDSPLTIDEAEYIQKAFNKTGYKNDLRGKPGNHMQAIDYAKQILDDDISKAVRNEADNEVKNLTNLKHGLLAKVDRENPVYGQARSHFERNKHLESMIKHGERFNTETLEGLKAHLQYGFDRNDITKGLSQGKKLTKTEQKYYRYGVRDKLLQKLNQAKSDTRNISKTVFDKDTLRRLELMEVPEYRKMNKTIEREQLAMDNINRLLGGSQTQERAMSVGDAVVSPKSNLIKRVSETIDNLLAPNPEQIALMMTDPGYLAAMRYKANQSNIALARHMGKYNFGVLRAAGPLTRKNHPNARISSKGWDKIKNSPDWRTFETIKDVRNIYGTGDYYGPNPTNKQRKDFVTQWHWFENPKANTGIQIGEDKYGRLLYNINPKVRDPFGSVNTKVGSLNNISLAQIRRKFNPFKGFSQKAGPYGGVLWMNAFNNYPNKKEIKQCP